MVHHKQEKEMSSRSTKRSLWRLVLAVAVTTTTQAQALAAELLPSAAGGATQATRLAGPEHPRANPQLIQAGERLVLLGVTSDNHAVYQDGTQVYATELKPGAAKQWIGSSPPGVVAFAYTVGKVAFVWTQPDRSVPGFGVSPLTVWSQATGAKLASENSPIGTFTTSASADGRYVMYPARGNANGSVGDIEFASTDMALRKTLVAGVPMAFPFGPCRPWGSFVGQGARSHPVALFCESGAVSATLGSWSNRGDARTTLVTGVLTQPFFTASPDGRQFFTALAGARTPVVVNERGELRRLEEGVLSRRGFFTSGQDVFYSAFVSLSQPGEIHRASLRSGTTSFIADKLSVFLTAQAGSDLIVTPPSSPDGRKLAYTTGFDANTGLSDIWVADLLRSGSQPVAPEKNSYLSGPVFSADSRYTLFARLDDPNANFGQLVAAGPQGSVTLGAPSLWSHDRLRGARIAFNDNVVLDPNDFFQSTADLKLVDLSRPVQSLTVLALQAYLAYYPANQGRQVVFTRAEAKPSAGDAGLYLARARPGSGEDDEDD
jgi:hypothetical protein